MLSGRTIEDLKSSASIEKPRPLYLKRGFT